LFASTATYRIYAPSTHALPSIEATTSHAELQLDPLKDGIDDLPLAGARDRWAPPGVKPFASSFYVLGHSFELDLKAPRRLRELDIAPWKRLLNGVVEYGVASPPRLLICGRRSSGLSTLIRCISNRLVAKQLASSKSPHSAGVMLVDLDTDMPEFVPPGMISLVHISNPVFGPAFTHLMPWSKGDSDHVLKRHFLGDIDNIDLADWQLARVYDLLHLEKNFHSKRKNGPVVIVLPKWLNGIDPATASKLWNKMSPTQIVCLDPSPTSPHLEPWRLFAERENCVIHQLPAQVFHRIPAVREHDLQMQSYFHLEDLEISRQFWSETPILSTTSRTATLSYGNDGGIICAIILLGSHIALEDTYEALDGSLVALVAVSTPETLANEGSGPSMDSLGSNFQPGKIRRTDEDLPRWQEQDGLESFFAQNSFCLGLALVQEIDVPNRKVSLITGPEVHVDDIQGHGYRVALVVPKAAADGRFRTDWAQREMGISNGGSQKN
jgi:polynucleotide 5'-hydroxyl-kinase GRC3/NOL9